MHNTQGRRGRGEEEGGGRLGWEVGRLREEVAALKRDLQEVRTTRDEMARLYRKMHWHHLLPCM